MTRWISTRWIWIPTLAISLVTGCGSEGGPYGTGWDGGLKLDTLEHDGPSEVGTTSDGGPDKGPSNQGPPDKSPADKSPADALPKDKSVPADKSPTDAPPADKAIPTDAGCKAPPGWIATAGTPGETSFAIAMDSAGNSYITGTFSGTATFGTHKVTAGSSNGDLFVAKLDKSGKFLWAAATAATGSGEVRGLDIAVDGAGNGHVTGYLEGTASFGATKLSSKGYQDVFVAKLDKSGKFLWASSAGGTSNDRGEGIALDSAGNAHVTGNFLETASFGSASRTAKGYQDIFLTKLSPAGAFLWATSAGGSHSDRGRKVAVDGSGNSLFTGQFSTTASFGAKSATSKGLHDMFVAKADKNGKLLWVVSAGGSYNDFGLDVAADGAGNAHVVGYFQGTVSFGSTTLNPTGKQDAYVARVSSSGAFSWATALGGSSMDVGYGIALDSAGNSHVTGSFGGVVTVGSTKLTSKGAADIFAAKLGKSGKPLWAVSAGGLSPDEGYGVALDSAGNSHVTGTVLGAATFGTKVLSLTGRDLFVARINACGAFQ